MSTELWFVIVAVAGILVGTKYGRSIFSWLTNKEK
jgi:hypothetical protein